MGNFHARRGLGLMTAAWAKTGGVYPWDYRIEYLLGSSSVLQYFKTGVSIEDGIRVRGRFCNVQYPPNIFHLFGAVPTESNYGGSAIQQQVQNSNNYLWRYGGYTTGGTNYIVNPVFNVSKGVEFDLDVTDYNGNHRVIVNGINKSTKTNRFTYGYDGKLYLPVEMYLLAICNTVGGSTTSGPSGSKLIGEWDLFVPMYDEPVRKFIPCVKDGIVCLYDEVTKSFFYNAGQGSFIEGPRVNDDGTQIITY